MTESRLDKLNASLRTSGLDAVILNPGPTLTHLTGMKFHLMERPVVLLFARDQVPAIVLPELELQKVASLPYELQVFAYPENPSEWGNVFRRAAQSLGLDGKRIGVEPRQLRLLEYRFVKEGAPEATYPEGRLASVSICFFFPTLECQTVCFQGFTKFGKRNRSHAVQLGNFHSEYLVNCSSDKMPAPVNARWAGAASLGRSVMFLLNSRLSSPAQ